ncbi:hypothetical protein Mam01_10420 [Microbispora amethystogenes]|uniref:Uncharacterized protein n=1 Tax=Microbispora amethystogenes TaxID=1427754 RepID=A0ABQ4F7X5_9ACTN|nr:hypothetical protein Mam01_10420 [Microbispora amethystogenes]
MAAPPAGVWGTCSCLVVALSVAGFAVTVSYTVRVPRGVGVALGVAEGLGVGVALAEAVTAIVAEAGVVLVPDDAISHV